MKQWILTIMCILLMAMLLTAPAIAEQSTLPTYAQSFCSGKGGHVVSCLQNAEESIILYETDVSRYIALFSCIEDEWHVQAENPHPISGMATLTQDSDMLLILTNPDYSEGIQQQFYFTKKADGWFLTSVIRYESFMDTYGLLTEYATSITDRQVITWKQKTDSEGNIRSQTILHTLPNMLTDDELNLATFDGLNAPVRGNGYATNESGIIRDEFQRRLSVSVLPNGYAYVDGVCNMDSLLILANKVDGTRVLLCCLYDADAGWSPTESSPLPPSAAIGYENFTENLYLGGTSDISVHISYDGPKLGWHIDSVLSSEDFYQVGQNWVSNGLNWRESEAKIGSTPWRDITMIDWTSIPAARTEAEKQVDPTKWATPVNPNPSDRLHLREQPKKDSKSLGRYYNGTPVYVLERSKEWSYVRIGETCGYMMTKYLAFGHHAYEVSCAFPDKFAVESTVDVLWDGMAAVQSVPAQGFNFVVIGIINDDWYLIWEPHSDRYGRVRQSALWDGNG